MNVTPAALIPRDAARQEQFKRLTTTPRLAWPTVALWLIVTTVYVGSDVLAVVGAIPLWAGMWINGAIGYLAFSVVHDSIHRSISTHTALNDFIGQCAVFIGAPYVNLKLFRWAHIQHHRFTSGPKDPDIVLHGPAWSLPLRWLLIDVLYLRHALRQGDKISRPYLNTSLRWTAYCAVLALVLIGMGYGWHLFYLWFLPSRMVFLALGFSFFWLPHVPHDTVQADNFTRATTVRLGHEWLLGPLLQSQNYHLIHHLYPMTPFFNNRAVWQLIEPELRRCDLAIQHGFAIQPTLHLATNEGRA